jgi:predicted histone-like DNA-binding protein
MALKIKAKEKKMKFSKDSEGVYRYVMVPELYSTLDQQKVIEEAAIRSGVSQGVMAACWKGAGDVIRAWATEGHSVTLPGLGTMRFGLSAKSVEDVNDVKKNLIKTRRIIFTPSSVLKQELATTAVQITCYDRNGEIVKRVISDDDGTVEEPDNEDTTNGGNENQNENQNPGGTGGGGGDADN